VQLGLAGGVRLEEVLADSQAEVEFAGKGGFAFTVDCHASLVGLLHALRGIEPPPAPGDARERMVPDVPIATCWHWSRRMEACVFFGNFEEALRSKRNAEALVKTSLTHYDLAEITFFGGMAEAVAGDLSAARQARDRFTTWAETCPPTFAARQLLLGAEIAARAGETLDAARLFERAIEAARESGLIQDEALASERAASFYEAAGFDTAARAFHASARYAYERWGASGKVKLLDAQGRAGAAAGAPIGNLDVATVVEMSRAISGEIELERTVARLVELAVEHAGATRGLLVLPGPKGLRIEAEALSDDVRAVRIRRAPASPTELSSSILRYVTRTLETVIVDDAQAPGRFEGDEYLQSSRVRAVFCAPLVKQGKLTGALYLENALTPNAFTPERVEVLRLLGSQAAVSLENAFLFESLKRAELDLSEAQRLSQTGSFRWNAATSEIELSDEACRIYGFEQGSSIAAGDWFGRIEEGERERIRREMDDRARGRRGFETDHRLVLPDGTRKYVRLLAHPAGSGEGGPELLGAVSDVTAKKRAEEAEALQRAKEAAEAANRAKDDFLANVSHEIRTPMNAILGMTELVLESNVTGEQRRWLGTAQSAAERLLTLIDELLDFSKIEAGKMELVAAPFSLRSEMDEITRALAVRASAKGIALVASVDPAAPDRLLGDAGKVRQILLNLVGNAVKFTAEGKVSLGAFVEDASRPGTVVVRFTVEDTGIGIPEEKHALVFEAFTQENSGTTRLYGGTGLGLTIAARLARLMGGEITLTSAPGRGSTFTFAVPFETEAPPAAVLGDGARIRERAPARTNLDILVAEDNDFNGLLMLERLAKRGHHAELVKRGTEALARLERAHFDVLLLDLHMPDKDGFEVAMRVRERERETGEHLPIVACTARSRKEDRERCFAAGMDAFLAKPIRSEALWNAIDGLMDSAPVRGAVPSLIDPDALFASCDGDPAILEILRQGLLRQLPLEMNRALGYASEGDAAALRESAHKLFGIVATVSTRAGELASRLEDEAAQGDLEAATVSTTGLEVLVREILERIALVSLDDLIRASG
jgi:signal transduction histidine kinase/ActR/RegA family two-component response regulator